MDKSLSSSHNRVSALSLGSQRFLDELGAWKSIQTSPYKKMFVWDSSSQGKIEFNCSDVQQPALGFIVEDQLIKNALLEKLKEKNNVEIVAPITLEKLIFAEKDTGYQLKACGHDKDVSINSQCNLIIAADGAQSWVREQAEIKTTITDYQHKAITATVTTELPHQQTAWQCFSPEGPLAFLPLEDSHQCSIVWSIENTYADELLALNDNDFQNKLTSIFANKLGNITLASPRAAFPLKMHHAKNYVLPHLALAGDAAHTLHPLAGQGVNLGLQDAACLASIILSAFEKNRDYSSLMILRKYERERKSENTIMLRTVDSLKTLFASEKKWLASIRGSGLNLVNKTGVIKNFFIQYAMDDSF